MKKSIIKSGGDLTRRSSGASDGHKRDLTEDFEQTRDGQQHVRAMQEELADEDMRGAREGGAAAQPPLWWVNAWTSIEQMDVNADEISTRMDRMFRVQSQRMDSFEKRLEPEKRSGRRTC